jgi:hypothetical protein
MLPDGSLKSFDGMGKSIYLLEIRLIATAKIMKFFKVTAPSVFSISHASITRD